MAEYNKVKDEVVKGTIIQLQDEEIMLNLLKKIRKYFYSSFFNPRKGVIIE